MTTYIISSTVSRTGKRVSESTKSLSNARSIAAALKRDRAFKNVTITTKATGKKVSKKRSSRSFGWF